MSGSIQQSGTVTPGHPAVWVASNIVADSGAANAGSLNAVGIYGNGGSPLVITNSPTAGITLNE